MGMDGRFAGPPRANRRIERVAFFLFFSLPVSQVKTCGAISAKFLDAGLVVRHRASRRTELVSPSAPPVHDGGTKPQARKIETKIEGARPGAAVYGARSNFYYYSWCS